MWSGQRGHSQGGHLTAEAATRQTAVEIADATFWSRQGALWGQGSTAVATDSTQFGHVRSEHLHRLALPL